jgi:hypothetical protein
MVALKCSTWRGVALLGLAAAALLVSGCSSAPRGGHLVFADPSISDEGGAATTVDIVDVGMGPLHNLTGHSVRVIRISLVSVPPAVRLLGVTAHPAPPSLGIGRGDLAKPCRTTYPSYPVTDAVTAPHADSNWDLVLAIAFTKPGRYHLGLAKIYYTTDSQMGWQYEHLNATLLVTAAGPGTKPVFDGCL